MLKLKDTVMNTDILIKKYAGNSESQNLKSEYVRILGIVKDISYFVLLLSDLTYYFSAN